MVLVLKHVPTEDAGTILDFLSRNNIYHRAIHLYEGERLPDDLTGITAVVIMGGPMNVYEEDKFRFLKEEDRFIQKVMRYPIPILGICLGSQLIAKAMGAKVKKAAAPEVGWDTLQLTKAASEDLLFSTIPSDQLKVLQWHEDTFDLPPGATLLASSALVPNQAYRLGRLIYGFQFHIEVDRLMLEEWFKTHKDLKTILKEHAQYQVELKAITERFYEQFFVKLPQLLIDNAVPDRLHS